MSTKSGPKEKTAEVESRPADKSPQPTPNIHLQIHDTPENVARALYSIPSEKQNTSAQPQ